MSDLRGGHLRGAVALACALVLVGPLVAHAGPNDGSDDQLRDRRAATQDAAARTRGDLAITSGELADAYAALTRAQGRLPAARAREERARAALAAARAEDARLAARLAEATRQEQAASGTLSRARRSVEEATRRVGAVAAEMQATDGGMEGLSILVQAQSPQDLQSRYSMLESVGTVQADSARELATVQADAAAKQARLSAVQDSVTRLKTESARSVEATAAAERQATTARREVEGLVAQATAAKAAVEERKAEEQARLTELDAEAEALTSELAERARRRAAVEAAARAKAQAKARAEAEERARERSRARAEERSRADARARAAAEQARSPEDRAPAAPAPSTEDRSRTAPVAPAPAAPAPAPGGGVLARPSGGRVTSVFGMRFHPVLRVTKLHTGTDFGTGCGAPILAAADGTVMSAGMTRGYGNRVVVDHGTVAGHDLVTTYNHLTTIVAHGGRVSRGQLLGYSGTTGYSTGCHLHFETLVDGAFQDPMRWL